MSMRYWLTVVLIIAAVAWVQSYVETGLNLRPWKSWLFRHFASSVTNPPVWRSVKLVVIRDDEYWDGDLHHRVPVNRLYLARLLRALNDAEASVIALDFDFRSPHPVTMVSPGDYWAVDTFKGYRDETDELIRAIGEVAQHRKIVLAKTIGGPKGGPYEMRTDIYQPYGICSKLIADGEWKTGGTAEFPLPP